jgi:hypothetical protein
MSTFAFPADKQTLYFQKGDSLDILKNLPDASVAAIVTDPPYGISFMNRKWDSPEALAAAHGVEEVLEETSGPPLTAADKQAFQKWAEGWLKEALRVLEPGGIIKIFGGTRMFHRMGAAMRAVGFDLIPKRALEAWAYGSGFPKSLNISKAIDRMQGAERERVRVSASEARNPKVINGGHGVEGGDRPFMIKAQELGYHERDSDIAVTDDAKKYQGYGTALKPAWEPFLVAHKPIEWVEIKQNPDAEVFHDIMDALVQG